MEKKLIIIMAILALFLGTNAYAADLQKGIMHYKWGESASNHKGLEEAGEKGEILYYSNSKEVYSAGTVIIEHGVYGFYKDQLFGAYYNIIDLMTYDRINKYLRSQYGLPAGKTTENDLQVFKWKDKDITIKLKRNETTNEMKLAFYYRPISTTLHAKNWDEVDESSLRFVPISNDKKPEKFVLFEF